ncbi:hypothetical protein DIS24_g9168 [Lasiodiplodia hormozganensis]|uniref:Uncharacterized protein n=1 Tax=Lasiodiplodia hormozganensis TaxID=869390 RepID=A0AA40CLX1_9PEZI|nr:hypothetical protein DIS24_g9168 [Lasiodiplodia hormozganensis]
MKLRNLEKVDYRETRPKKECTEGEAAGQRRTASGRVTKSVPTPPKRRPGRPPKSVSKRSPKQGPGSTSANALSVTPKKASSRSMKREYQPVSPIVKIVKKTSVESEHHSVLMHKFFRAHEDEVAHIPKKKQRKALGKLWRESLLNPKNARAQKEGAPETEDMEQAGTEDSAGEGGSG